MNCLKLKRSEKKNYRFNTILTNLMHCGDEQNECKRNKTPRRKVYFVCWSALCSLYTYGGYCWECVCGVCHRMMSELVEWVGEWMNECLYSHSPIPFEMLTWIGDVLYLIKSHSYDWMKWNEIKIERRWKTSATKISKTKSVRYVRELLAACSAQCTLW